MEFPKSLARESLQVKKSSVSPFTIVGWIIALLVLIVLARSINLNNTNNNVVSIFNPRVIPNSSVSYTDNSIVRTAQAIQVFPISLGNSNKTARLLRAVSTNGDQTMYSFTDSGNIIEQAKFSTDFRNLKYLTGNQYVFATMEGLYLNDGTESTKIYSLKTGETMQDYFYYSPDQTFYLLLNSSSGQLIIRIGAFGEQELYRFNETLVVPSIRHVDSETIYISDIQNQCVGINIISKIQSFENCNIVPSNSSGVNYYLEGNLVKRVDTKTLTTTTAFEDSEIVITRLIQLEDQYAVQYVQSSDNSNLLFVSNIEQTIDIPNGFNVFQYYVLENILYVTDGKALLVRDLSQPVSSAEGEWVNLLDNSSVVSISLIY